MHIHTHAPHMVRTLPEAPATLHLPLFPHFISSSWAEQSYQRKAPLLVLTSCKFMARNHEHSETGKRQTWREQRDRSNPMSWKVYFRTRKMTPVLKSHIVDPRTFPCYAHNGHPPNIRYKRLAQRQSRNLDTSTLQLGPCPEFLELFAAVACGAWLVLGT